MVNGNPHLYLMFTMSVNRSLDEQVVDQDNNWLMMRPKKSKEL